MNIPKNIFNNFFLGRGRGGSFGGGGFGASMDPLDDGGVGDPLKGEEPLDLSPATRF